MKTKNTTYEHMNPDIQFEDILPIEYANDVFFAYKV